MYFIYIFTHECVCKSNFYERVLVGCLKLCSLFIFIMLQKSVAVPLVAPEPGEDAVQGPVNLPGARPRDAVRNAHLFMRGAVFLYQDARLLAYSEFAVFDLPESQVLFDLLAQVLVLYLLEELREMLTTGDEMLCVKVLEVQNKEECRSWKPGISLGRLLQHL